MSCACFLYLRKCKHFEVRLIKRELLIERKRQEGGADPFTPASLPLGPFTMSPKGVREYEAAGFFFFSYNVTMWLWSTLGFKSTEEPLKHIYYHIYLIVFLVVHAVWRFKLSMNQPWPQASTFNWHWIQSSLLNAEQHTPGILLRNPDTWYRYVSPHKFI